MPLLVYRPKPFVNSAENKQFRALCAELQKRIHSLDNRGKEELCIFVGNFNFNEKDLDAFLIKKDGILLIEFKNYGGKIVVDNNSWRGEYDGQEFVVEGGSGGKTPYEQAKNNRNAFKRGLSDSMALTPAQADKIASVVIFNHDADIDNKLRLNIQTWLHVCDNVHFFGMVEDIVNQNFNMSPVDLKRLAERIVLDEDYIWDEYTDTEFLEIWNDPDELQKFSDKLAGVIHFPDEPSPFEAAQKDEEELNPEQNPELTVNPVPAPDLFTEDKEELPQASVETAVPCDHVPIMVANYISLVQQHAVEGVPFCVYDCLESAPAVDFDIEERYLVKVMIEPDGENTRKLGGFLRTRTIYQGDDCLYWTIGEQIPAIKANRVEKAEADMGMSFRQSSTMLAPWLDAFIFNQLEASYDPRYQNFDYNKDLGEEEAKIYLGTSFPSSYAENFLIFENLLLNQKFRSRIEAKRKLVLFSVGAGTGGDIIGLLTAIDKYLNTSVGLTVVALDSNRHSLALLRQVMERYRSITSRDIDFKVFEERIEGEGTLAKYAEGAFPDGSIDFLLFSKVGYELHGNRSFGGKNVYRVMLEHFMQKISDTGVFSIVDYAEAEGQELIPLLMNQGVNSYIAANPSYATIVPQSCCAYERDCAVPCRFHQEFSVSHCKKTRVVSRICYRLIAHRELCDAILNTKGKKYIVVPDVKGSPEKYCQMSTGNQDERDAFNVNN